MAPVRNLPFREHRAWRIVLLAPFLAFVAAWPHLPTQLVSTHLYESHPPSSPHSTPKFWPPKHPQLQTLSNQSRHALGPPVLGPGRRPHGAQFPFFLGSWTLLLPGVHTAQKPCFSPPGEA